MLMGPGLLSMSPARRRSREMIAGESFLGVEKMCAVCVVWRVVEDARATEAFPRESSPPGAGEAKVG